ncbi:hypothetical protein EYC56_21550 [Xanthomonas oryzae]|nr:hypothetical protein EYC56_21550 [Xanthomonas oryzae]
MGIKRHVPLLPNSLWKLHQFIRAYTAHYCSVKLGRGRRPMIRPGFPRHLNAMENGEFGDVHEQQAKYGIRNTEYG